MVASAVPTRGLPVPESPAIRPNTQTQYHDRVSMLVLYCRTCRRDWNSRESRDGAFIALLNHRLLDGKASDLKAQLLAAQPLVGPTLARRSGLCGQLGLGHSAPRPCSLRHGEASDDLRASRRSLEQVMARGRRVSSPSLRRHTGATCLGRERQEVPSNVPDLRNFAMSRLFARGQGRRSRHRRLLPPFCPAVGLVRPAAPQQVPRWGWYVQLPHRGSGGAGASPPPPEAGVAANGNVARCLDHRREATCAAQLASHFLDGKGSGLLTQRIAVGSHAQPGVARRSGL